MTLDSTEGLATSTTSDVDRKAIEPVPTDDWTGFCEAAPNRQPNGQPMGPCGHCRMDDCHLCTGVGCFGCKGDHGRYGVAGGSDGLQGGSRPEGKRP